MGLTFDELRAGNLARLPQFKNSKGEKAHSEADGSDWQLSAWSNAVLGELGEVSEALSFFVVLSMALKHLGSSGNIIKKIERGDASLEERRQDLADELADVQTYLDILAYRAGIDLGKATIKKWNEVSERVHCDLRLWGDGS
jgi:NTP pyrophosphatase (non-canonical NTP hydrolase)